MKRAEDLGREIGEELRPPKIGPADQEFLKVLHHGIHQSQRRRRALIGVLVGFLLAIVAAGWLFGSEVPSHPPLGPETDAGLERPAPLQKKRSDPVAALLLEAAELRLEGYGDAAGAIDRLELVVATFPQTISAIRAAKILKRLKGSSCSDETV